jgi:hypothetical protein
VTGDLPGRRRSAVTAPRGRTANTSGGYNNFWKSDPGAETTEQGRMVRAAHLASSSIHTDGRVPQMLPEAMKTQPAVGACVPGPTSDRREKRSWAAAYDDQSSSGRFGERLHHRLRGRSSDRRWLPTYFYNIT